MRGRVWTAFGGLIVLTASGCGGDEGRPGATSAWDPDSGQTDGPFDDPTAATSGTSVGSGPDATGDATQTCAEIAASNGWQTFRCDNGNAACSGFDATPALDCASCCAGPSCTELSTQSGWMSASCDNGSGECGGMGTPTWDCGLCCAEGGSSDDSTGGDPGTLGFGYPVGDKTSYPAGGWVVWQVLGHYWSDYGGRHLAQDIASSQGGVATVDAPVYAVADGLVRYAGTNSSTYRHVVLIEHDVGNGEIICSFFGHINAPMVQTNDTVTRGQQITTVMDWAQAANGASSNTHLHYVFLSKELCDASAAAGGSLICGYDGGGPNGVDGLDTEPYYYTSVDDTTCYTSQYPDAFISPTQFIEDHHF